VAVAGVTVDCFSPYYRAFFWIHKEDEIFGPFFRSVLLLLFFSSNVIPSSIQRAVGTSHEIAACFVENECPPDADPFSCFFRVESSEVSPVFSLLMSPPCVVVFPQLRPIWIAYPPPRGVAVGSFSPYSRLASGVGPANCMIQVFGLFPADFASAKERDRPRL